MTHDLSRGHNMTWTVADGGNRLEALGWDDINLREGDYVILPNRGKTTRYTVKTVEMMLGEMWAATLIFAPRHRHEERKSK